MHSVPLLQCQWYRVAQLILAQIQPLSPADPGKQHLHRGVLGVRRPRIPRPYCRLEEQAAVPRDLRPVRVPEKIDAHEVGVTMLGNALRTGARESLHRVSSEALLELLAGDSDGTLMAREGDGVGTECGGRGKLEEVFLFEEELFFDFCLRL